MAWQSSRTRRDRRSDEVVLARLRDRVGSLPSEDVPHDLAVDFLEDALRRRLKDSHRQYRLFLGAQLAVSLLVGLLGATAAVAAAGQEDGVSVLAIVAGALVPAITAVSQAWQPGARAERNKQRRIRYRQEAWEYLMHIGRYKGTEDGDLEAWTDFAERLGVIAADTRDHREFV